MMACRWCIWHTHRPIFCLFGFFLLSTFLVWTEIVTGFLLYMHTKLGLIQVAALVRSISHMVGVCNRGWGREAAVGFSPLLQFMRPYSPHTSSGGANLSTSVETGLQDSLANKQALAVFKTTLRSVGWIGLRCSCLYVWLGHTISASS